MRGAVRKGGPYRDQNDVSIKLKQSQRVFIVQCGCAVLVVAVTIGFVVALV